MASILRIPPGLDKLEFENNLAVSPVSFSLWGSTIGYLEERDARVWVTFAGVKHMRPGAWIKGRGFEHAVSEALRVAEGCVDRISISISPNHRPIVEFRRLGNKDWSLVESQWQKLSRKLKHLFGFHS
jgi:hypothetical protein